MPPLLNTTALIPKRWWIVLPLGLLALILAHYMALIYRVQPAVSLWFPPSGVAIALTLWFGPIGVVLTAAASIIMAPQWGIDGWMRLVGLTDAVEPLVAWWLYRHYWQGSLLFGRLRDAAAFTLSAPLAACAVSAIAGNLILAIVGKIPLETLITSIPDWWLGNAIGTMAIAPTALLLITPILLARGFLTYSSIGEGNGDASLQSPTAAPSRCTSAEATGILVISMATAALAVSKANNANFDFQQLSFLSFVPILWAAIRFGITGGMLTASFCVLATLLSYFITYPNAISLPAFPVSAEVLHVHKFSLLIQCAVSLFVGTFTTERSATQVALAVERARNQMQEQLIQLNRSLAETNTRLEAANCEKDELLRREQIARGEAELARELASKILGSITDGFLAFDRSWRFTYLNHTGAKTLGRTVEELLGKNLWEEFPELDNTNFGRLYRQAVAEGVPLELEDYYDPFDTWFVARAYPSESGLSLYFRDISKRKQAEAALYRREQEFKALVENSPDIIARVDPQLRHVYINAAIELVTGLPPQAFIGKTHPELGFSKEIYAPWQALLKEVFSTGKERAVEFSFPEPSGITKYYQSRLVPEFNLDGSIASVLGVTRDITELKQTEVALRQSETRLRRIIDSNMIGVFFGDLSGNITEANDAFLQIVGYTRSDLLAGNICWDKITPLEYFDRTYLAVEELREYGVCVPFEKEFIRKDGGRVFILIAGALFEGSKELGVCYVLDISDRKQAEKERDRLLVCEREARQQAEAANRIKDEFLAVLSHELRSPLNPILGWVSLLRTRKFDAATTNRALEIIERNAKLQTQLIDDLLDVSRILRGKLSLNLVPVNLVSIIEAAIETVLLAARSKSIDLTFSLGESGIGTGEEERAGVTKFLVSGDANRLQQIVWNLLNNAIKFTPAGGKVEVRLSAVIKEKSSELENYLIQNSKLKTQNSMSYAQIQICDTGIGIDPDFLPHVFEHFRQADSSITRKHGGLGLGLAIVHHLVELHGGTIEADSPGEGKGATFIVKLPLLKHVVKRMKDEVILPSSFIFLSSSVLAGLRVLVVDDEADSREFVTFVLEEHGAEIKAVASTFEALEALRQFIPDIIVSDIGMPEADGYELLRQVRQTKLLPSVKDIPAIALTAYAREEDARKALEAGFQMHLSKPIEPDKLVNAIASLTANQS